MESFDTWRLVSLSPLPLLALAALGLALVVGVWLACRGVRTEPRASRRWLLWGLRVVAGACALFFLLEPGVRRLQVARVKSRVAVLVDRSASMAFPAKAGGASRSEVVAGLLERLQPDFEARRERYAFEVYGFDPELSPVGVEALRRQPPTAGRTDLFSALRAVGAERGVSGRGLSGVILLSDGADNVDLAHGLAGQPRAALERLGVPVSTVAIGREGLVDLAVGDIKVDDFAFVRSAVTADVEVRARGFSGRQVQVLLRREGQVVATQQVSFTGDDAVAPVRFTFTPDQTGRFVYTVSVPVFPEETVAENNVKSFALKVIRDRVRVLLVAGRPTWDERFLRGLLKQDANVELISFYILRSSDESSGAVNEARELSLIPFPKEEIFRTKIDTFDLIMVLNFSNDDPQVSLAPYRDSIEAYVEGGGALAYLGGDRSFGEVRTPSPLADVLPLIASGPAVLDPFIARLTADGQRHPVTAVGGGGLTSDAAWAGLPAVSGMNLTRARPGAVVLLEHPTATVDGRPAPLLAVGEHGRGRTLALATDGSWVWAFTSHAGGAPSRAYERFWTNAIRWLVRDPDLTTLSVTADPPSVEPGQPVTAVVVARTSDYQPAPGAQVSAELLAAEGGEVVGRAEAVAGPDGTARLEFPPPPPGPYKVVGRATLDGRALGDSTDSLAVRSAGPELSDARVNRALLEDIAKATGGAFFDGPELSLGDVPLLEPPLVEVGRSKDAPLWDRWYWLALMVGVLGLEWAARRRFGYI